MTSTCNVISSCHQLPHLLPVGIILSMEQLLQVLNAVSPMSEALVHHLVAILKERTIQKNEYLLKAGQVSRDVCFIEKGLLRCFYQKGDKDVSLWFMKEHDVIFSVISFYNQKPWVEYIQAIETTTVYYITYQELQLVYAQFPEFERIGRLLTEKYYQLWHLYRYAILLQNASERYQWLLDNHPELALRVPAKYLASFLDITEVTFSKIKGKKDERRKGITSTFPG